MKWKYVSRCWFISLTICLVTVFLAGTFYDAGAVKKPEVIRIAFIGDLTGPYAPITAGTYESFIDCCEYVNKVLGGVKGVPLEPVVRDSGGKVDIAISHYMELRDMEPRPIVVLLIVSGEAEALRVRLQEDDILGLSVTSNAAVYPKANTLGLYPEYADQFGLFVDWMVDNWDRKKMGRAPKLAFLTWDSTYGRAILVDEAYAYARKKGVDVVATEVFGLRDMDVSTQLVRIKAKGADWIYTNCAAHGPVVIAKSAHAMRYNGNFAGGLGVDWSTIYVGGKVMEGWYSVYPFVSWDEAGHSGTKLLTKYFKEKKRNPKARTIMYQIPFVQILMAKELIERCVDRVGWENLNGSNLKEDYLKLKDYRVLDGLAYYTFTPVKYTPRKARLLKIKGGRLLPVTDWRNCPDLMPEKYK